MGGQIDQWLRITPAPQYDTATKLPPTTNINNSTTAKRPQFFFGIKSPVENHVLPTFTAKCVAFYVKWNVCDEMLSDIHKQNQTQVKT